MRILAAHDGGTGCAWYRILVPLKAVNEHSEHEVLFRRATMNSTAKEEDPLMLEKDVEGVDLVVVERVNYYDGLGLWRRWSSRYDLRTVYENDDDIWNITQENFMAYKTYEEGTEIREAVLRYCDTANMITCTTPHLGDMHREMSPSTVVELLPNYIPEWVLDLGHDKRDRLRVGWVGGASHSRDIQVCTQPVKRFLERFPDWDLCIGGEDYRDAFKADKKRKLFIPWIHVTDEPRLYYRILDFDIGLCPLLDTKFARSKSPVKALEYMARGIPVIASDVEPYARFIKHGVDGFLCKREHEWLQYLTLLAKDENLRLEMGRNAKAKAAANTIEKHWHEWTNAYKALFPIGWQFKDGTVNQ